ncbi:hypothetical protein ACK8OR_12720 [Jannaschia sp. KMU-145]|uniref:hypothetical protein n=1 Tax=Jannaschia halovivens TaxID=3388667 RepID=UPI00396B4243
MIRTALLAALTLAVAQPAMALSCLRPTVQSSFQHADQSEAQYTLAVGRIRVLPGQTIPEQPDDPNQRQGYELQARFQGQLASATGFDTPADFPVTLKVECVAAWCGGVPLDRVLAFVERTEDGNLITEGPCPRDLLQASPEALKQAMACIRGEPCEATDRP